MRIGVYTEMTMRLLFLFALLSPTFALVNQSHSKNVLSETTWTKSGAPDIGWRSITSDSTGQNLFAISYMNGYQSPPGQIYKSTNYGFTWVKSSPEGEWMDCVSSESGQHLVAYQGDGNILVSSDFGATWVLSNVDKISWQQFIFDSMGQRIVAVGNTKDYAGLIYLSSDFGQTWTSSDQLSDYYLNSVASSNTGQNLLVAADEGLFRSTDSGASWVPIVIAGEDDSWTDVVCSSTCEYAVASTYYTLYRSIDFGASWTELVNKPSGEISHVVMSSNGQFLAAIRYDNKKIYVSSDYGDSWVDTNSPPQSSMLYWSGLIIDNSGEFITAAQLSPSDKGEIFVWGPYVRTGPTSEPTQAPTAVPSVVPSPTPTDSPTIEPSVAPSEQPTIAPTYTPTQTPSSAPIHQPTEAPTGSPTITPSTAPTAPPSLVPTVIPSAVPTLQPTQQPTAIPTCVPSLTPTNIPSLIPTTAPSLTPTAVPTQPTQKPTTVEPTRGPSRLPTIAPTAAQIYQTSVQQTLKGVSKSQYVAELEANNLAWCTTVALVINGAPEDCTVISVEAAAAEALRRRLSTTNGVNIGYTVAFDSVALGHPGDPAAALNQVTAALNASVVSGNFSTALMDYAQQHGMSALTNVTATSVVVSTTYSAVTTDTPSGSSKSSSDTTDIIIGVVVGGGGGLILIALCVVYYVYCAGVSSATTHSKVQTQEPTEGVECMETADSGNGKSPQSGAVVTAAGRVSEATL